LDRLKRSLIPVRVSDKRTNLQNLLEQLFCEGYYRIDPNNPPSVNKVLSRWVIEGDKAYDEFVHGWYSVDDLWPYREYTWAREDSRRSPEEWDELKQSLEDSGWSENDPLLMMVGENGKAKVGEGNHRLAVARGLGLDKVPVRFEFWKSVSKTPAPPTQKSTKRTSIPNKTKQKTELNNDHGDDHDVDDIMKLLGFG